MPLVPRVGKKFGVPDALQTCGKTLFRIPSLTEKYHGNVTMVLITAQVIQFLPDLTSRIGKEGAFQFFSLDDGVLCLHRLPHGHATLDLPTLSVGSLSCHGAHSGSVLR
eukprot:symbB.v1.2.014284.t1/scaffold1043.1/size142240/1